jgi:16S rRNA C1402 (ribose-2'-O) methylase RsmI
MEYCEIGSELTKVVEAMLKYKKKHIYNKNNNAYKINKKRVFVFVIQMEFVNAIQKLKN